MTPPRRLALPLGAFAVLLALAPIAQAQRWRVPIDTPTSTLAYDGHHRFHDWTGTSRTVRGTLVLDAANPAASAIAIGAPLASFDSGNGNRDANMLETTEALRYPAVTFASDRVEVVSWTRTPDGWRGAWRVTGRLALRGVTRAATVPVDVVIRGSAFEASASFPVSLSAHGVRRPSLLSVPISDTIELTATIRATLPPQR